jgi:hypothetical protein
MTEQEYKAIRTMQEPKKMIGPLVGFSDRTLLYGYDCDRRTWHVYQEDGHIHRAVYITSNRQPDIYERNCELDAETLVPNKRLYPEACDYMFCERLKALGIYLSFTTYGTLFDRDRRYPFVGRTF